ncbi:hypothetical protein [Nocardia brasiliensis]|uniref:hypothetical protein n=1 Tax=Nocardia brasiliensis TaxID=37326 RepID=UPI001EEA7D12|nr:hypothetical protein [Nocardia brasiliensis]
MHLARGAIGFGFLAASMALLPVLGWIGLVLLVPGLAVLRGCPTCWAIGLMQTLSRGRLNRVCTDGQCRLQPREPSRSS